MVRWGIGDWGGIAVHVSHMHFCEVVYCIPPIRAQGCAFRSSFAFGFDMGGAYLEELNWESRMLITSI